MEEVRLPPYDPHNVCPISPIQTTGNDTSQLQYSTPQADGRWFGMQLTGRPRFTESSGRMDTLDIFETLDGYTAPTPNNSPISSSASALMLAEEGGQRREGSVHGGAEPQDRHDRLGGEDKTSVRMRVQSLKKKVS